MHKAEETSGEIQNNVTNAPSDCRFSQVVPDNLWHVFDQGNNNFKIPKHLKDTSSIRNFRNVYASTEPYNNIDNYSNPHYCTSYYGGYMSLIFISWIN